MSTSQRRGLLALVRRLMMAGLALSALSTISVERAPAQALLPPVEPKTYTLEPNPYWSQLDIPAPREPLTQPTGTGTGTWTFGEGVNATASVNVPALDPQLGRILQYSVGASTTYKSLNAVVTSPLNPIGRLASVTDTLTASGLGLTATGTGTPYFYCVDSPCSSQMAFVNYNDGNQEAATQIVYSPTIPWSGNATAFVQANQALYGAQTVTLKMSTVVTNEAGTLSGYSVTGPYQASLGRALVPWTTDDVVSGTLKFSPLASNIGAAIGAGQLSINPKPQLGFTAQQAANLSNFTNFNYIQRYTSTGVAAWNNPSLPPGNLLRAPTIVYQQDAIGTPLFEGGDPRSVGDFDPLTTGGNSNPLIGGNPDRIDDQFDPYYDQVAAVGAAPNNTVFDDANNFGLNYYDRPDLSAVGDFITFQTQLVGVDMSNNSDGSTTVTYSPLDSSVDGTLDQSTIFNWMWVQYALDPNCLDSGADCGNAFLTDGSANSDDPYGMAFFLGYGELTQAQLDAAIDTVVGELPDFNSDFTSTGGMPSAIPEPSTWGMLLIGFAGLGLAGYRKARSARAAVATADRPRPLA